MSAYAMRCEQCGRSLTPCPARWDGEDTFVGFYPCHCEEAREVDRERDEWRAELAVATQDGAAGGTR